MNNRLWILGAPDPEMAEIEALLVEAGQEILYAALDFQRADAGTAYQADGVLDREGRPRPLPVGEEAILVECSVPLPGVVWVHKVDHHRPGDPGYGLPPEAYWQASSLGQVCRRLGAARTPEREMVAAADHCLAAAYRGRCPRVDPDALARWRAESRARFQGRPVEAVLADIAAARGALRAAPRVYLGEGTGSVADLRGMEVPELPEAAAREGLAFLAAPRAGRTGRFKIVLQAADPDQVRVFMGSWARAQGLKDVYGDPARGFAGGYED